MKKYSYSVSTMTIWTSFDYGEVEAENEEQAREKAIAELTYNFDKANRVLASADVTKGFDISFDSKQVQIREVK